MKSTVKPITFRIYPDSYSLYARVFIWPTLMVMREQITDQYRKGTGDVSRSFKTNLAACHGINGEYKSKHRTSCIADLHFAADYLVYEAIVHECFHAALHYARRKHMRLDVEWRKPHLKSSAANRNEEYVAYAQEQMISECVRQLHKRHIGVTHHHRFKR